MTFHAPGSSRRVLALVAKRLVVSRTALIAAAALISSSVVLAGRSDGEMSLTPGAILQDESLVLQQLDLPAGSVDSEAAPKRALAITRKPSTLSPKANADDVDLPVTDDDKQQDHSARPSELSEPTSPVSTDTSDSEIRAILADEPKSETVVAPRTVDVAVLESANAPDFHDDKIEPRAPEFGPVPIVPAVARVPDIIEDPALDFLTSGPFVISLAANDGESLEDIMKRSGMSAEDRMATLVALRADNVEETMMDGDIVDLAFLGKNDRDLLGIRLRQLGQIPVEVRWDEETAPLWAGLAPLDNVFTELEAAAPATLSVTGKPDDTVFFAGEINSSLYQSAKKAGLNARQTKAVENIFRYSIDFQRDLRKGDRFEVLFEKQEDGTTGDILYTKLTNRGSEIALYLGTDDLTGLSGYFDATGKSNKRSLMRTPISGARISSHFGMRHHPILGYNKMHRGTDFAAPRGTPIFAAGDGVIDYLGRNGAYGKYIRIRHNGVYKTAYAHMSRYAPHLVTGSRVRQGDVIGYVGSTGRSTGPHLHFEILENDNRINPMRVADFGPVQGLSGTALANFMVRVSRIEVAVSLLRDDVRVAEAD